MKYAIFILGTLVMIAGWLLGHAKEYPFVRRVILPEYAAVLKGLEILNQDEGQLTESDPGFAEISGYLKSTERGDPSVDPEIQRISITGLGTSFAKEPKSTNTLRIEFSNRPSIDAEFSDFHNKVKSKYSESKYTKYDVILFIAGIVISIVGFVFSQVSK